MKRTSLLTTFVLLFACFVPLGNSQQLRVEVTIPFDFEVSDVVLPAGEYLIETQIYPMNTIAVRSAKRHNNAYVATIPMIVSPNAPGKEPQLVFNRYGEDQFARHFLTQAWSIGGGAYVVKSKSEKEMVTSRMLKETAVKPPATVVVYAKK